MKYFTLALLLCLNTVNAAELRVATAANFYHTLDKIKTEFEKKGEHRITIIRGSTGKLYAQIMHGAPYDLFLSADTARADKLIESGKADKEFARVYASGQLVLWKPKTANPAQLHKQLMDKKFNKLAIANPKTAPYGKAAIETLKALGIYQQVKSKLVYAENIAQAVQYVESGAADIGLVARSLVKDSVYWQVKQEMYAPIKQKMLILKQSRNMPVAKVFYEFMQSQAVTDLIRADGYSI